MNSILRYFASLAVVLGAYWLYAKIAVPLVEPSVAQGSRNREPIGQAPPNNRANGWRAASVAGSWIS